LELLHRSSLPPLAAILIPFRGSFASLTAGYLLLERRRSAMPQEAWREKRERQYEHIKKSVKERGAPEDRAEEIAARTVNKERARSGEARESSRLSRTDISSGRRGGRRAHRSGPRGRTRDQLYEEARDLNIEGRSRMTKEQLRRAVDRQKAS
jgi:hypothetical protein